MHNLARENFGFRKLQTMLKERGNFLPLLTSVSKF